MSANLIEGPFGITKFCGATVISIQSSAGYQEQVSTLQLELVEADKDRFIAPEVGEPKSFVFEGMRFDGLVQRWARRGSVSGNPTYSVTLHSPVEILEGAQIILDAYRGVNLVCPNLLNVFGYLEDQGNNFGGSSRNESGIPWYKIKEALLAIQEGGTDFSPGIEFKGHKYKLDLEATPSVPDFYRIGGGAFISLNQVIRTLFEDAGYEYLVYLEMQEGGPHLIKFKSRSRLSTEPLGQIEAFVDGKENTVSLEQGAELRNDITCGVIFGGEQETCIAQYDSGNGATIWPFWGFQQTPFLIPYLTEGNQPIVPSTGYGNDHVAILNASPIGDIVGAGLNDVPTYTCSVFEMRLALVDQDSWSVFIARKRPEIAALFGLDIFPSIFGGAVFDENPQSFYADNAAAIAGLTNNWQENPGRLRLNRLYEFVKSQAETFFGKQFLVRVPFWIKSYFEEETGKLFYNTSVNQDGYYPDYITGFNTGPLGLSYENFNHFMTDSGKFMPFLKFGGPSILNANPSLRGFGDMIIQNTDIFIRCNVDSRIIFAPTPAVIATINEPLWSNVPDPVGGIQEIAWLCDMTPEALINVLDMNNGEFPVKIHPMPYTPIGAAICLKSHDQTYGPWTKIGAPGQVKIEQDLGLVPWNYGSIEAMNTAAEAQLAEIGTTSQREESGTITVAGAPDISLGDQLNGNGPIVNAIDVAIGNTGVTTTFRMRSQTPVFGVFSKQNAERIRRLGVASQDMRRTMRAMADRMREHDRIKTGGAWIFNQNASRAVTKNQSVNVLQAFIVNDANTGAVLAQVCSQSFAAALGSSQAHDPSKYQRVASMGMEGLLRPFSTSVSPSGVGLPHYETPSSGVTGIKNTDLDPFKAGSDLLWAASGENFQGYYTGRNGNPNNARPLGLRGPLILVGHGREVTGKPVPNSNNSPNAKLQEMTGNYLANYLTKFDEWKVGPVDLRWDKWRKVWGPTLPLRGVYIGSNKVKLDGVDDEITVDDYLDMKPAINKKVAINYYPLKNIWFIVSKQC